MDKADKTNKVNKKWFIIILITLVLGIMTINVIGAGNTQYLNWEDLADREKSDGTGHTLFCLDSNATISDKDVAPDGIKYTKKNTIWIKGNVAWNDKDEDDQKDSGEKSSTYKVNAKLAYICHAARNESVTEKEEKNSNSQNGIWKYWKVWGGEKNEKGKYTWNRAKELDVNEAFRQYSTAENQTKADNIENKAENYYDVLMGNSGITIDKSESKVNKVKKSGKKYNYVGPFYITKDSLVSKIKITGSTDIAGYSTSSSGTIATSVTFTREDGFYIVLNDGYNTSQTFTLKYDVKVYNAKLELYSSSVTGADYQPIAWVNTSTDTKELSTTFEVKTKEPTNVSIQKYITQVNGKAITTSNTSLVNRENAISYSTDDANVRANPSISKNATASEKNSNPVMVKEGDTVTYKIDVYNNSSKIVSNVKVKDNFLYNCNDSDNKYTDFDSLSIKIGSSNATYTKVDDKYEITVGTLNPNATKTITVQVRLKEYVNYKIGNSASVSVSNNSTTYRTKDKDYIKFSPTNVSIQKYITKVNGENITKNNTSLTTRVNTKTYSGDKAEVRDKIYNLTNGDVTASNNYKRSNPVKIELGDTVTYRVYVYNNSEVKANSILIKDTMPYYTDTSKKVISYTDIVSIYQNGGTNDIKGNWNFETNTGNNNTYNYTITNLAANSYTYFDITLRIKISTTSILWNTVWVSTTTPNNSGTYRTVDRDFVQMAQYKVSLEKFVSKVTGANGEKTYDRDGYRHNEALADGNVNKNVYKKNNRVLVETGDKVTFTIRLKNTGDNPVKISQIYDSFRFEEAGTVNGLKLVYDSTYGIKGNGDGTITDYHYNDDKDNNNKTLDRYFIQFNNATLLNKGEHVDVTIRYTVEAPAELTASNHALQNKAGILQLKNQNNIAVADSDGTDNNYDMDWVQIKPYKVSLKKYVSKVTDKNGGNAETYDRSSTRLNAYASNKNNTDNYNEYKKDNKVLLEAGDKVTYTIILKNEGDTPVKISKIYDFFSNKGLEYDGSSIQGNGGGKVTETVSVNPHGNNDANVTRHTIAFDNPVSIPAKGTENVTITFNVISNISDAAYCNVARILELKNNNNRFVADSDGTDNNTDEDWVKLKKYAVSLQKFVYSVNGSTTGITGRVNHPIYKEENYKYDRVVSLSKDDYVTYEIQVTNTGSGDEYADIKALTVIDKILGQEGSENGTGFEGYYWGMYDEKATLIKDNKSPEYTINDGLAKGETKSVWITLKVSEDNMSLNTLVNRAEVKNDEIINRNDIVITDSTLNDNDDEDYINMKDIIISGTVWNDMASDKINGNYDGIYDEKTDKLIKDNVKVYLYRRSFEGLKYDFNSDNIVNSTDVTLLKNVINAFKNKKIDINNVDNNNIPTIIIEALNDTWKTNSANTKTILKAILANGDINNNKKINETDANLLYNRLGSSQANQGIYETKLVKTVNIGTDGKYSFSSNYIKGPKTNGTNRWAGKYYSYYVVFEYDGITYTSTIFANVTSENSNDSNAKEDNSNGMTDLTTRADFNKKFSTINNSSGINYETKNEEGYIPQSRHQYNNTMAIKSSTNVINLSNDASLETKLQHVNLGLRGRDIFDLELTSNVDTVKVTINNQQGVYRYSNRVNLRQADLYNEIEDMANPAREKSNTYVDRQDQYLRNSDFNVGENYSSNQGISNIEVTYKITVQNASNTVGTATKITNYYDSKYNINMDQTVNGTRYYYDNNGNLQSEAIKGIGLSDAKQSGTGYKSVLITIPDTMLNQSDTMDIYVVYTLNIKDGALNGLTKDNPIPTYNMAEITEYKTKTIGGETEYTRGLIDKDSAPGSANIETVRLATGTSDKTTVEYYFAAQNLQNLKYEDDTYATPTLYFVIPYDDNKTEDIDGNIIENKYYNRIITGKVFRDETVTDATTKIKTGNGKLDEGEAPVYGATVELIEQVDGGKVRYTTTTGTDGSFRFSGFLPGNYVIRYYYGDTENTVLLKQNGEVNAYSFNGEDYQATNNSYNLTVKNAQGRQLTTNILEKVEEAENFWYLYNENKGISTAKDDTTRRDKVSKNVIETAKSDNIIRMLNAARAGENIAVGNIETQNSLIEQTYMFADTDAMLFTVEKTELVESKPKPIERFEAKYIVKDMNFGIAEIPVTTIDLQKEVQSFTITDVTGKNIIAQIEKNSEGKWINKKNVLPMDEVLDVSIEDEKLQGARLQVKYNIIADISVEKNYDGKEEVYATIGGLNDYIDNNLSYNEALGENSKYWEVVKDNNNTQYSTIVKATIDNPILSDGDGNKVATITLEKVLSSTDSTIDEIITSTVDIYEYNNTIKITQIKYNNCPEDKVRDLGRYIILAGEGGQHNGATAQTITIHPPTGDSSISTVYYIIAAISLAVLAAGVFGIKKFVVKK